MKKTFLLAIILLTGISCSKNSISPDFSVKYEILGNGTFDIIISTSSKSDGYVGLSNQLPFNYTMTYAKGDNYSFHAIRYDAGTSKIYFYMFVNDVLFRKDSSYSGGLNFTGVVE